MMPLSPKKSRRQGRAKEPRRSSAAQVVGAAAAAAATCGFLPRSLGSEVLPPHWEDTHWTAVHQWTPLAANITILRRPWDAVGGNVSASWRILHLTDAHISMAE
ncbi:unnamed protein product, partial [Polarella glacialis]